MKKILLPIILLLVLNGYGQSQRPITEQRTNYLWSIMQYGDTKALRKETTTSELNALKSKLQPCVKSLSPFGGPDKGPDCDLQNRLDIMISRCNYPGDHYLTWNAKFGVHQYGSYDDKIFFIKGAKGSPFIFNCWPNQEHYSKGCVFGFTTQKSSYSLILKAPKGSIDKGEGTSITFTPEQEDVGKAITLDQVMHKYNRTSCNGSGIEPDVTYKTSSITVENPHWTDRKNELSSICNNYKTINLFDYFSFSNDDHPISMWNGLNFYLNERLIGNNLNISSLKPGLYHIKAVKNYDNGTFEDIFQITILPVPAITIGSYPKSICANESPFLISVLVDGQTVSTGKWAGTGIDDAGNFKPKEAGLGLKILTYNFKSENGCSSSADIQIEVKPVPVKPTITGQTEGCVGEVLKLFANSFPAIAGKTKYLWYKSDNNTIPFHEGATLEYPIQKTEKLIVKSVSDAGCTSDQSTEVKITSFTPVGKIVTADKTSLRQHELMRFQFVPERGTNSDKYSYVWDFGDGNQSYEVTPPHYFNNQGSFQVKVTITSPEQCANTIIFPDQIQVGDSGIASVAPPSFPTPIVSEKVPLKLNLFPNPFASWLEFTVNSEVSEKAEITIINQEGFIVYQRVFDIAVGDNEIKFDDLQNLTNLLYEIKISSPSISFKELFIKKN